MKPRTIILSGGPNSVHVEVGGAGAGWAQLLLGNSAGQCALR